ncbi:MAG: holo-[acyl-carrier-protein] synthase [Zetaproteobacteria bacterium CG2_30_46_52]|nr:MAG: holo-[acyl-carrier-protein] synthase [Zetaproteobacteria bacterium CG2_30_46_52]
MAILGIGVDRIKIARIEQSVARFDAQFIKRVYSDDEYKLAKQRGTYRRLAMFFAAKEAVAKAMGTGFIGFAMKDVEVVYLASGKPEVRLHRAAKRKADALNISSIHLSLTDDDGTAMAFAIAEGSA